MKESVKVADSLSGNNLSFEMRKIAANLVLSENGSFLENSYIELSDSGEILNVVDTNGKLDEIAGLEFYNGILCPRFVNSHCHLELSHLKGKIDGGKGLHQFISSVVKLRASGNEEIVSAMQRADMYMQKQGIAAVGDISNGEDSFELKLRSPILYHTFLEVFGTGDYGDASFSAASELYSKYEAKLPLSIVPHAPYSVGPNLFAQIKAHAVSHNSIISVHNQEAESENEMFTNKSGKLYDQLMDMGFSFDWIDPKGLNSLETTLPKLPNSVPVLFIHNSFMNEADAILAIETIGAEKCFFVLCPKSNLYIENKMPRANMLSRFSDNIAIGTDSLSSNNKLSVLEELLCLQSYFPDFSANMLLTWATINGAKALRMDEKIGSFSIGKTPGVILIEKADLKNRRLSAHSTVRVLV